MEEDKPSLPARIQGAREAAKLSRAELASKLGWTEIRLWRLETGKTKILAEDVQLIAAALERSVGELYGEAA